MGKSLAFKDDAAAQRFWNKVDVSGDCWVWLGGESGKGYGSFWINGRLSRAHRVSYTNLVGPIPDGLDIDHICYNRRCVRPEHLQPVTRKQNLENRKGAQPNSRTGIRGVSWHKKSGKWCVQVHHDGVNHHGGLFDSLDEANAEAIRIRNELYTNNLQDQK